jgi:cell wall-associated NlpC family hydrolase
MPVGAVVAAGSLALTGASVAAANTATASSDTSAGSSYDEQPVPGEVAATRSDTESVRVSQTRTATAGARKKLTKKVIVRVKSTAKATRSSRASAEATVTRYAPTLQEAVAEATAVAHDAAHQEASDTARSRAGKAAAKAAHSKAKTAARSKAAHRARTVFGNLVVRRAAAQKGKPYRWGATGPNAFDCSGLVGYVMKGAGVNHLPRTSGAIAAHSKRVSKAHKKRGDVIIFGNGGGVYHIAIYAGKGRIWHAPGSGRSVRKVDIWTSGYRVGRLAA